MVIEGNTPAWRRRRAVLAMRERQKRRMLLRLEGFTDYGVHLVESARLRELVRRGCAAERASTL